MPAAKRCTLCGANLGSSPRVETCEACNAAARRKRTQSKRGAETSEEPAAEPTRQFGARDVARAVDDEAPTLAWDDEGEAGSDGRTAQFSFAAREEGTQRFGPAEAREARAVAAAAAASARGDLDEPEGTRQFAAPRAGAARRSSRPPAGPRAAAVPAPPPRGDRALRPPPPRLAVGAGDEDDEEPEHEPGVRRFGAPAAASEERTRLVRALLQNAFVEQALRRVCAKLGSTPEGRSVVIDLGTLVANADGRLDQAEMEILREAFCTLLGDRLHATVVQGLVASSRQDIARRGADARAREVGRALASHGVAEEGLTFALAVGYASNGLSAPEQRVLDAVAEGAGLRPERAEVLARRVSAVAEHDWSVPPR